MNVVAGAALLVGAVLAAPAHSRGDEELEPIGVWNCLMYGPFGDQRFYLRTEADGAASIAWLADATRGVWRDLSGWTESRSRVRIEDAANDRELTADLEHPTLGGTWSAPGRLGGWWCAPVSGADAYEDRPPGAEGLMPVLVPAIMASPSYPREAIREAKEGRAVACFLVDGRGEISDPHLVEISDEVFREPTLTAVSKSRYERRNDEQILLPACRTFTFELQAVG
ncbi:MAG TPA: energy transducer TonB [Gammaproteobacteria bacterium]